MFTMQNEETQTVTVLQYNDGEEQQQEEVDAASRWIPVALKLAMANSEEELRPY